MAKNEIDLFTDLRINIDLPKVDYDLKALSNAVNDYEQNFKSLIIFEEDLVGIRKDISKVNKLAKAVDTQRKDIENKIKENYAPLIDEMKSYKERLDTVYRNIKDQIDNYTEQQKELKRNEILALEEWENHFIFQDEWLNSKYSISKIKDDIDKQRQMYDNNSVLIKTTCNVIGLNEEKYLEMLKNKKDINSIILMIENDKEVLLNNQQPIKEVETPKFNKEDIEDTDKLTYTLKITGTYIQLTALKKYLKDNNIEFEKM